MPTFNQGIRTKAGDDLFSRVDSGETKITYTKVVFSSLDLSSNSDEEIENLTDIQPQELATKPEVLNKSFKNTNNAPETEIRAVVSNESLSKGMFIKTYGLYASDDQGHNILYGVSVDDHPSYLPAFTPNERPQQITYNWDTAISDTNDINFTDTNDAYATYDDLNDYETSASADNANTSLASDIASNSASISNENTSLSSLISNGTNQSEISDLQKQVTSNKNNILFTQPREVTKNDDLNSIKATGYYIINNSIPKNALGYGLVLVLNANGNIFQVFYKAQNYGEIYLRLNTWNRWQDWKFISNNDDLQDQINKLPTWSDENWTRNNVAPQLATNAMNQANNYTNSNIQTLRNDIKNKLVSSLVTPGHITSSGNLDYFNSTGVYNVDFHTLNSPNGNNGTLFVINAGGNIFQTFYEAYDTGKMFKRHCTDYGWTNWQNRDIGIQTASNEHDAQNKSNNNQNILFVYSD